MKRLNIPSLTLIISILPFLGYLIAHSYESGYLSAFEIPNSLVQIGLSTIILTITSIITILCIIFFVVTIFRPFLDKYKSRLFVFPFLLFLLLYTTVSLVILIQNTDNYYYLPLLALLSLLLVIFIDFIFPIIKYRTFNNYAKLVIKERDNSTTSNKFLSELIPKNLYFSYVLLALLVFLTIYKISSEFGHTSAIFGPNTYYVFKANGGDYAVVRNYQDYILSIKYNKNTIAPGEVYIFKIEKLNLSKRQLYLPESSRNDTQFHVFNDKLLKIINKLYEKVHIFLNATYQKNRFR